MNRAVCRAIGHPTRWMLGRAVILELGSLARLISGTSSKNAWWHMAGPYAVRQPRKAQHQTLAQQHLLLRAQALKLRFQAAERIPQASSHARVSLAKAATSAQSRSRPYRRAGCRIGSTLTGVPVRDGRLGPIAL